jgi:UDP-glucose 4-epimerase
MASSSEVYGSAQYDPMDENHPLDAPHPYGASKIAADRLCFAYNKTYNMPITICRFFNIFGPRQRDIGYGGVISLFLRKSLQNIPLMIYGDGMQVRDYLYITDAISAYKTVLDNNAGLGPYNFGTCRYISILEIAKMISDNIVFDKARPSEVKKLICNYAKANRELNWEPKISFEDGLEKFKQWFRIYGLQDKI